MKPSFSSLQYLIATTHHFTYSRPWLGAAFDSQKCQYQQHFHDWQFRNDNLLIQQTTNVLHTKKKNLVKQAFTCSDKQAFAFKHACCQCYVMCQYKVTTLLLTDKSLYVPHLQGVSCLIMILTFFGAKSSKKHYETLNPYEIQWLVTQFLHLLHQPY